MVAKIGHKLKCSCESYEKVSGFTVLNLRDMEPQMYIINKSNSTLL